jgi:chaperonin GroES
MITLRPLGDRVVIIPDVAEEEKVGHIIIPETNVKERPKGGTIVAIGDDEELNENLKVGDRVVYANYGGTQTRIDHQDYVVACYNDILLVLEDSE